MIRIRRSGEFRRPGETRGKPKEHTSGGDKMNQSMRIGPRMTPFAKKMPFSWEASGFSPSSRPSGSNGNGESLYKHTLLHPASEDPNSLLARDLATSDACSSMTSSPMHLFSMAPCSGFLRHYSKPAGEGGLATFLLYAESGRLSPPSRPGSPHNTLVPRMGALDGPCSSRPSGWSSPINPFTCGSCCD